MRHELSRGEVSDGRFRRYISAPEQRRKTRLYSNPGGQLGRGGRQRNGRQFEREGRGYRPIASSNSTEIQLDVQED